MDYKELRATGKTLTTSRMVEHMLKKHIENVVGKCVDARIVEPLDESECRRLQVTIERIYDQLDDGQTKATERRYR